MKPLLEKHNVLRHMKIIACQVYEKIFKTIDEVKNHVAEKLILSKETAMTIVMLVFED